MNINITTAIIASFMALTSAVLTIIGQIRITKLKAELDIKKNILLSSEKSKAIISKYREPLIEAAYDFQAKLFNITNQGLLRVYYLNGSNNEREYTVKNTIYVIAQFLAWREIIRQEIQYLDLGEEKLTRNLNELLERIQVLFLTDEYSSVFRIFRGEQRAIGEKMITNFKNKSTCIGYAKFIESTEPEFQQWFIKLEKDIEKLSKENSADFERLIYLQHALIDLLTYLDPQYIRFPEELRKKV